MYREQFLKEALLLEKRMNGTVEMRIVEVKREMFNDR